MKKDVHELSQTLIKKDYDSLSSQEQHVIHHISVREPITEDVLKKHEEQYNGRKYAVDEAFSG
jgi:hypothetical protein